MTGDPLTLVSVYRVRGAAQTLYELLAERTPEQSISHRGMPSLDEHAAFVRSMPYQCWYLVQLGERYVGSVYLTKQREIGVFIFREHWGNGYGEQAVRLLMAQWPGRFLANVAPRNETSCRMFEHMGFRALQVTYASS